MKTGAPSLLGFNITQNFFGYSAKHKTKLHEGLFELLWVGEGRWSFDDIYNLPLGIRKLWISKIKKIQNDQAEHLEKLKSKNTNTATRPNIIRKKS